MTLDQLLQHLPPVAKESLLPQIRQKMEAAPRTVVVLDDDPTGTQTVHGISVLTEWSVEVIAAEFEQATPLFYILTNSRSLPAEAADRLGTTIGQNLIEASRRTGQDFFVISRSDSTLRGHYPNEVDALLAGTGQSRAINILVPAFLEGGRYTIGDTHYVQEGEQLIPVGDTPFAQDKSFGFTSSNLKQWVEEKTGGRVRAEQVRSFSLSDLRQKGVPYVTETLRTADPSTTFIVNAAHYRDLEVFALGLLNTQVPVICRTAASVVPVIAGLPPKPLLSPEQLLKAESAYGGLVIVGSHVPKSTTQLTHLLDRAGLEAVKIEVSEVLNHPDVRSLASQVTEKVEAALKRNQDVVIYTSRTLITGETKEESLAIGQQISSYLTRIVQQLQVRPRYLLAKGGITASDTATNGLSLKRAEVMGQILPGVPVWKLGPESKFPGLPYIVFPGNVGEADAITRIVQQLRG